MQLACPQCGTRETRVSRRYGLLELLKGLIGTYPLRCRRCKHRWLTSVWSGGAWHYARCPRCYRQDLTTWSEQYYHPRIWTVFLLRIGATPYRCGACRCNFASFKPCKEKFSWRHEIKVETPPTLAEAPQIAERMQEELVPAARVPAIEPSLAALHVAVRDRKTVPTWIEQEEEEEFGREPFL